MIQEMLRKHLSMLIKQMQLGKIAIFSNRKNSSRTESEPHVAYYKQDHPPGTFSDTTELKAKEAQAWCSVFPFLIPYDLWEHQNL